MLASAITPTQRNANPCERPSVLAAVKKRKGRRAGERRPNNRFHQQWKTLGSKSFFSLGNTDLVDDSAPALTFAECHPLCPRRRAPKPTSCQLLYKKKKQQKNNPKTFLTLRENMFLTQVVLLNLSGSCEYSARPLTLQSANYR